MATHPYNSRTRDWNLKAKLALSGIVLIASLLGFVSLASAATPPVSIISPSHSTGTASATSNVSFSVNGSTSIPVGTTCTVNGVTTSSATTNSVPLAIGANSLSVSCGSSQGTGSASVVVDRGSPPNVAIVSPANNYNSPSASVNVSFTVDGAGSIPGGTSCLINGTSTSSATSNTVSLLEGANTISASCSNGFGSGSSAVTVTGPGLAPDTAIDTFAAPSAGTPVSGAPSPAPSVSFHAIGPATGAECRVPAVNTTWVNCTSSSSWTIPTSGMSSGTTYRYEVRAVNGSAADADPAAGHFYLDNATVAASVSGAAEPNSITTASQVLDAGRHPDLTIDSSMSGWDDPQNLSVQLPDGLMIGAASITEANKCNSEDAFADACSLDSKIGTISGSVSLASSGDTSFAGALYLIKDADTPATSVTSIALVADLGAGHGKFIATGLLQLSQNAISTPTPNSFDAGREQILRFTDLPQAVIAATTSESRPSARRFHLRSLSVSLAGSTGSSVVAENNRPLVTNPHYCGPEFGTTGLRARPNQKKFVASIAGWSGSVGSAQPSAPYSVSCIAQSFAPTASLAVKSNSEASWVTSKPAGSKVAIRSIIAQPKEDSSAPSSSFARVAIQTGAPYLTEFGSAAACSPVAAKPNINYPGYVAFIPDNNCPPGARVGTVRISSNLYSSEIVGNVYLIYGTVPSLGFWIDPSVSAGNPKGVTFGFQGRFSISSSHVDSVDGLPTTELSLNSLPDIPIDRLEFTVGDNPDHPGGETFRMPYPTSSACLPSPADSGQGIPAISEPAFPAVTRSRPWSQLLSGTDYSNLLFPGQGVTARIGDVESRTALEVTGCAAHY